MRRCLVTLVLLGAAARPSPAQSLSERLGLLFFYTGCELPLCLTVNQATHGTHYTFQAALASTSTLQFFTNAIGATLGSIPVSATSSGVTFRFVGGAPVATATSAGPIFAERAQTLGRGRVLTGVNTTRIAFNRARGTHLRDVVFNFDHQDLEAPGLGNPVEEYDLMQVRPWIRLTLQSTSFFATYGLSDRVDVGVALPVVAASLRATSTASFISPIGRISGLHLFGTDAAPTNTATSSVDGSHTGIGDVAVRAKINVRSTDRLGVAFLGDVRLPTGDADNFTGTGEFAVRAVGVVSARHGDFSPHANAGIAYRTGEAQNSSALLTVGFDQLAAPWLTLAVDLISEAQFGDNKLNIPPTVFFANGMPLASTNVPDRARDDRVNFSAGAKFLVRGTTIVVNGLLPLNDAGVQASRIFTLGVEHTFR